MKKTLLLAGVASFIAYGASAADFSYTNIANEIKPYVGADYVYSYAKFGGKAKSMKDSYHSGSVYMGTRMYDYMGLEAFFQMSGKRENSKHDGKHEAEFLAYGVDLYGYMPLWCGNFNLLGSLGAANYRWRFKYPEVKAKHQNRIGYRAGIGAQYDFNENWAIRVMGRYTYLGMSHVNDLKEVTAGLKYTF